MRKNIVKIVGYLFLLTTLIIGTIVLLNPDIKFDIREKAAELLNPSSGSKFVFINHPQRDLTEEEMQYIATNYDIAVVGNQNKSMTTEANRLKQLNPSLKVYLYFPTSVRQDVATNYGNDVFKEEWYLHKQNGERIAKTPSLDFVDLTNLEYRSWAESTILKFLSEAPYDGVLADNANPLGAEGPWNWLNFIGQDKINSWNSSRINYLTRLQRIMESKGKTIIYNGISRSIVKTNRTLDTLDFTSGALNEGFCYGKDSSGNNSVVSKELQVEDIELQKSIGLRKKILLQKVNIDSAIKAKYGKYCYGIFLMGHVPGYTYFKYGEGYSLAVFPEEYKNSLSELNIPIGSPKGNYKRQGWLLYREFSEAWVVVNLNETRATWTNPDDGKILSIAPQDAIFIIKTTPVATDKITPPPSEGVDNCRDYCKKEFNITRSDAGYCAFAEKNCALNPDGAAVYSSGGDKFCQGDRGFCCCKR